MTGESSSLFVPGDALDKASFLLVLETGVAAHKFLQPMVPGSVLDTSE